MKSLYFDTTNELEIGLLDEEFNWVTLEKHSSKKASQAIHGLIAMLLQKNSLELNEIEYFFHIAGPGSYTGMRVSTGLAQILEWNKYKTLSFYHYDIAKLLHASGLWVAKAFKNEFYFFEWNSSQEKTYILSEQESLELLGKSKLKLFSSFSTIDHLPWKFESTSEMLTENSRVIFPEFIKQNYKKELFYFRPLSEEFKKKES